MHSCSTAAHAALPSKLIVSSPDTSPRPDGAVKHPPKQLADTRQLAFCNVPKRIIRMKNLVIKLGVSRSCVYDWLNPQSPRFMNSFPRPFRLSESSRGAVGWSESVIDAWIASRGAEAQ
jgi:prophage regulatory protein